MNTLAVPGNVEVSTRPLAGPQLVQDYAQARAALAPFFAGFARDPAAFARVAGAVDGHFDANMRGAMADAVQATSAQARARLERIADGDGFFVATGQQAGLFGGPLFTIYKTLTTIKLAALLEQQLGVTVAPLFWIAADDHDFAEVNHAYVFAGDHALHRLQIDGADENRSMNRHALDDSAPAAVEQLTTLLPANDFAQEVLGWLRAAYVPGNTVAGAFGEVMARMFERFDLLITSSAHPVVKSLAAPVILRELEQTETHAELLRRQTHKLLAAGYHEQVALRSGAANVLYEDDNGRDRLVHEAGAWHLSRTKRPIDTARLHELLTLEPERFSPNVLLRPVVASAVFPTLAYVGGPAELSYFAQIGCLFDAHDVPMPIVVPRASLEVVEHKVRKVLAKFDLDLDAFRQPFDQLASQLIRDELPDSISATVTGLGEQIRAAYATLVDATAAIDPTLRGPLENARNASHKALSDVEKKIVSHLKKKNEIGIEQLRKAAENLYPNGEPQERVVNVVSYLARYGTGFLDLVAAQIDLRLDTAAPEWRGTQC